MNYENDKFTDPQNLRNFWRAVIYSIYEDYIQDVCTYPSVGRISILASVLKKRHIFPWLSPFDSLQACCEYADLDYETTLNSLLQLKLTLGDLDSKKMVELAYKYKYLQGKLRNGFKTDLKKS